MNLVVKFGSQLSRLVGVFAPAQTRGRARWTIPFPLLCTHFEVLVHQGKDLVLHLIGAEALGLQVVQALKDPQPVQGGLLKLLDGYFRAG